MTDQHASELATWALNTLGKAVALSLVVGFVGGVLAGIVAASGDFALWPLMILFAGIAAPLTFAAVLFNAKAPTSRVEVG
jgi:hypothetical protein